MAVASNRNVDLNHLHRIKERNHYDPCIVVIFGGAGDLSHRKLIPALYNLSSTASSRQVRDSRFLDGISDDEKYRAFALSGIGATRARPRRNTAARVCLDAAEREGAVLLVVEISSIENRESRTCREARRR